MPRPHRLKFHFIGLASGATLLTAFIYTLAQSLV
ncbi:MULTISPECIES: DUF3948 family protein [Bacillus cereus group]|nr:MULTISPECIES: DUF3948 family protein [Bacillus cereus group]MCC2380422.1 DUF3948 family protein [Bacillus wiedmannii]MCC2424419.1 DUF3948 family protein [Bacillus wiedmannii]MED3394875.1 DUF3948 family protein [Bacillus wiedmannii]PRT28518.1 DUF3948 domain-containing protein [Bacillus wiedmannii]PRT39517.1 DUF3948 domain-containing protein [Bacillus wiedmannii]